LNQPRIWGESDSPEEDKFLGDAKELVLKDFDDKNGSVTQTPHLCSPQNLCRMFK